MQALESNDTYLLARLFIILGEAHVGFAGFGCEAGGKEQKAQMRIAGGCFEKGREGMFSLHNPIALHGLWSVAAHEVLICDLSQRFKGSRMSRDNWIVCS
jgi:hypothetical protein